MGSSVPFDVQCSRGNCRDCQGRRKKPVDAENEMSQRLVELPPWDMQDIQSHRQRKGSLECESNKDTHARLTDASYRTS